MEHKVPNLSVKSPAVTTASRHNNNHLIYSIALLSLGGTITRLCAQGAPPARDVHLRFSVLLEMPSQVSNLDLDIT